MRQTGLVGHGLVWAVGLFCTVPAAAAQEGAPGPYLRVTESKGGDAIALEVASREFRSDDPARPVVHLTGAVHIADGAFYESLQAFLDDQDVVLFEGVKPAGAGAAAHEGDLDDESRAKITERRLRFLAIAAEKHRAEHGRYPATLAELDDGLEARLASLVSASLLDAWGNPIAYIPPAEPQEGARRPRLEFISLGGDGAEGGEGGAADLRFSRQKPLTREERGEGEGIQKQMADAFGLVFQLEAMNENGPNWRNSDLSIDQVQRRLDEAGAEGGALFSVLDGSSFMGRMAGMLVKLIGSSPQGRAMFKVMLAEMLSRADTMFESLPGGMGALMQVIINDRNAVVIQDLQAILGSEPEVRTIAVIYGAGHLPDLERRLAAIGYRPGADTWRPAITVSSEGEKLPRGSIRQMRPMMKSMIEMQMRQFEQMRRQEEKKRAR